MFLEASQYFILGNCFRTLKQYIVLELDLIYIK